MERNMPLKQIQEIIKSYSEEELLLTGRELLEEDYIKSATVFRELSKYKDKKDLAELYLSVLSPIIYNQFKEECNFIMSMELEIPKEAERDLSNSSIESIITGMVTAANMHSEGKLSQEDLFTIEKIVDQFPFRTITIPGREEFERLYGRFKEYSLKVFVGEK